MHLRPHLKAGNFILWFADNICAVDAASMLHTLKMTKTLACVAMRSSRKEETGFADVEGDIVKRFVEKPTVKLPMKECIGVYALSPKIFPHIISAKKKKSQVNLSYDILAPLASKSSVSAHDIRDASG